MDCTARRLAVVIALLGLSGAGTARAQQAFPQTLYWGSGLIDIPAAWVPPLTGDFTLALSTMTLPSGTFSDPTNRHGTGSVALFGRVELGVAIFNRDPQYSFFGQALLLDEARLRGRSGLAGWLPSVAVGVRNVGSYGKADRFGIGYFMTSDGRQQADALHQQFDTAPTVYGVATKSFPLGERVRALSAVNLSATLGYGNGLFKDDGGLGDAYGQSHTGGVFGGVKVDVTPVRNTTLSLMLENNAWDYNLGATLEFRGLRAGAYWMGVGNGGASGAGLYNGSRFAALLGWQSNAIALIRPDLVRRRIEALERERQRLTVELAARQQRITALQAEITRLEAQNLLDLEERRAQAEAELRAERDALRRLEERIRRLEEQQRQQQPPGR